MQKTLINWNQNKTQFMVYLLIGLYLLLFLPFWQPVLLGFLFASALSPLVNMIRKKMHARRTKVAYFTVAAGLILFIGFIALIALQVYSQVFELSQSQESLAGFNDKISSVRDQVLNWTNEQPYLSSLNAREQIDKAVVGVTNTSKNLLLKLTAGFVAAAPLILLDLFIFITAFAAFLVIQPRLWTNMSRALRLGDKGKEHFKRFERICSLALGSVILTALMQSILVVIGAAIAGYGGLLMIFALSFVFALIPVLGAGLVPVILMALSFLQGNSVSGVIMLATAVIVGISDNILRAWLFSRAAESNPAISIITLLGGIALFGFPGLFIAPVIEQLVMTYAFSDEGEPKKTEVTVDREAEDPERFVEPIHSRKPEPRLT
jgi:predicted PurR-regulated permease PerM